jgi:hypothetical protein
METKQNSLEQPLGKRRKQENIPKIPRDKQKTITNTYEM